MAPRSFPIVHLNPALLAASLVFLLVVAVIVYIVRQVAIVVIASAWQKGNFIPFSLGIRAARTKTSEPLLASMPATRYPPAGAPKERGTLVLTPARISFQSKGGTVDIPLRAVRHLTVLRNGHLDVRTDGTNPVGDFTVSNPAAVAQMIQATFKHPKAVLR